MSAGRGGVLIGAAVIAGLLIFMVINRSPSSSSSGNTPTTVAPTVVTVPATNADGTPATAAPDTTATTKAKKNAKTARPNDQVVIQVLNGSGVQGAATGRTNDLKAKGYQALPAGNAAQTRTGTIVQCKSGYEKEADALAATLGELGSPATVDALPEPLPAEYDAAANCYVVLGA